MSELPSSGLIERNHRIGNVDDDSQAITYRGLRKEIGEILARNHLRTDQVAISELVKLVELEREDAQLVALAMNRGI